MEKHDMCLPKNQQGTTFLYHALNHKLWLIDTREVTTIVAPTSWWS